MARWIRSPCFICRRGILQAEARWLLIEAFVSELSDPGAGSCPLWRHEAGCRLRHEYRAETRSTTTSQMPYDVEVVRKDFPISVQVYDRPLIYLDNAASAQKPHSVLRSHCAHEEEYATNHRGVHFLSGCATLRFENARETVRRFINAASEREIVFTRVQPKPSIWSPRLSPAALAPSNTRTGTK